MRVLIADDDPVSRRLLEATLTRLGHDVTVVTNGTEAIDALVRPDAPRMAILDWMMPGADGLTVCRAVRVRADRYVYVVLLTAFDRRTDLVAALDAEADDFLTKPFDIVELRARQAVAAAPIEAGPEQLSVTISLGVSVADVAPDEPTAMIAAADAALYRAKAGGRNQVAQ